MNTILTISNKKKENSLLTRVDILKMNNIDVIKTNSLYEGLDIMTENGLNMIIMNYTFKDAKASTIFQELARQTLYIPVIIILDENEEDLKIQALIDGASNVFVQPFSESELLLVVSNMMNLSKNYANLKASQGIIEALSKSLEYKDNLTKGHAKRVAELSAELYDALGYHDYEERYKLYIGCLLHDIGKVGVPDEVLKSDKVFDKDGPEFKHLMNHPQMGFEMSMGVKDQTVLDIVLNHHEKLDGSGYPRGLEAKDISHTVRIVTIVDIFDSLVHKRTYRDPMSPKQAFNIIKEDALNNKVSYDIYNAFRNIICKCKDKDKCNCTVDDISLLLES